LLLQSVGGTFSICSSWQSTVKFSQEPLFCQAMIFNCPITQDMRDFSALIGKVSCHQQASMTFERFVLRTHQGWPPIASDARNQFQRLSE